MEFLLYRVRRLIHYYCSANFLVSGCLELSILKSLPSSITTVFHANCVVFLQHTDCRGEFDCSFVIAIYSGVVQPGIYLRANQSQQDGFYVYIVQAVYSMYRRVCTVYTVLYGTAETLYSMAE